MKITTIKVLVVLFTAFTLVFSSCVDESINLKKLSTDVKIGGNLAAPLGEITISIQDIMDSITIDSTSNISIGDESGVITIYFSDTLEYLNPAEIDFSSFGTIEETIDFGGPTGFAPDSVFPLIIPFGINPRFPVVRGYNFNDINKDTTEQRVDSIRFTNTSINVTVTSSINLPAGLASLDIQLPAEFLELDTSQVVKMDLVGTSTSKDFDYENFVVNSLGNDTTDFNIDIIVNGDGVTAINSADWIKIDITLSNTSFVAHGFFNYGEDLLAKDEGLEMDLYSILPEGSLIYPHNPEFNFKLESNIGVPLLFNLKELKSFDIDTIPVLSKSATFNGVPSKTYNISPAPSPGQKATTSIIINRDVDKGRTNELFTIKADSISSKFSFGVKSLPITTGGQFVTSDSKMKVIMDTKMPFWLDEGSNITITDTIKLDTKTITDILGEDNVKEAYLYVKATNKLPIGVTIDLDLLDADSLAVSTTPYLYEIKSGTVNAEGETIAPTVSVIEIKFTKDNINELKATSFIKFTVSIKGYDINSQMKFRMEDWLKLKVSAYGIGEYK